jgi:hypothetical protein
MAKKIDKKIKKSLKKIDKTGDVPVTQAQFEAFASEMKSLLTTNKLEFRTMEKRTDARFKAIDVRFKEVDHRFDEIDIRFKAVDHRFDEIDVRFKAMDTKIDGLESRLTAKITQVELSLLTSIESLTAAVHRTNAIVEEQNARNKFVIDGYKAVIDVQEDQEGRLKKLEKATFGIET